MRNLIFRKRKGLARQNTCSSLQLLASQSRFLVNSSSKVVREFLFLQTFSDSLQSFLRVIDVLCRIAVSKLLTKSYDPSIQIWMFTASIYKAVFSCIVSSSLSVSE